MATIIKGVNICREFPSGSGTIKVLKNINVAFEERALTILKGRSGSGKTTLMNILGLLDKPTSGRILINGHDITDITEENSDDIRKKLYFFCISVSCAYWIDVCL